MTKEDIITKLSNVVEEVLDLTDLSLESETIAKDVEGWDSISYIEIISEIEKSFNVKFKLIELESFEKIGDLVDNIHIKLT